MAFYGTPAGGTGSGNNIDDDNKTAATRIDASQDEPCGKEAVPRLVYEGAYEGDLVESEDIEREHSAAGLEERAHRPSDLTTRDVPCATVGEYGLPPVRPEDRPAGTVHHEMGSLVRLPKMSRRRFIATVGGMAGAALVALVGGAVWYTHRTVRCWVNGTMQLAPVGCSAADLVARGFADPRPGNLVAVCAAGETPEVLQEGAGEPWGITVNGKAAEAQYWRLADGDEVVFADGADVTEQVTAENTEIPCGAMVPQDGVFLARVGYVARWGAPGYATVEVGSVSGRRVDRGVTKEPEDFVIACAEHVNPADGRRLVALTFDDGPDLDYTPQYLDILAAYGARATFFNLGSQVDAGPEYAALSKRCADEGHQVASHTYSHANLLLYGDDERNADVSHAFEAVSQACGRQTNVMRPPYGNFYGSTFLAYLRAGGDIANSAYWGVDSADWEVASQGFGLEDGAAQIVANCTQAQHATLEDNPDAFNGSIILMHDGGGDRTRDVVALPAIIEAYQAQGFELVTLNELLASMGTLPDWVTSGLAARPADARIPLDDSQITWYDPLKVDPLA